MGESSGALGAVLTRIADHRERADAQWRKLRAALAYPVAVLLFALAITVALMLWVVPTFRQIFDGFGAALPAPTRMLLALAVGMSAWGGPLLAFVATAVLAAQRAIRHSRALRYALAQRLLHTPFAGAAMRQLAAARW